MRTVRCDGSPERVAELIGAIGRALDGGAPVLPVGPGAAAARAAADATAGRTGPRVAAGTAVVVATSGSSGEPKLVELPATALRASALATQARLGGPARWLLALPAEHVAGVQVVVRALLAGSTPAVQDVRGGFRPDGFATATAALGAGRRCTSLVPTQLVRLLDAGGAALDALRSYDAVLVGGAALATALRRRAQAAGVRVVATYGMTETCGGCVHDGVPLDGVRVELDAAEAVPPQAPRPAADRSPDGAAELDRPDRPAHAAGPGPDAEPTHGAGAGRIHLAGTVLASGYLGRPDETAAAFAGGWFRTGDVGRWVGGRLEVLGRADDVIVTGGEKVAAAAVERELAALPGVRAACVVGLPDPVWGQVVAAAVVREPAGPEHDRMCQAVREALGRAAVPRRLLDLRELPLRGVGKPDRTAITRLFTETTTDG